ncbi:MAG TPA: type IV pilus twitching motility protein PilT [Chromatiales bacterium]|nr:type IV pilus twitching motility protein PilT [Chromatiales bacterium]
MSRLDQMLDFVIAQGASDLHLISGIRPRLRRHGLLEELPDEPIDREEANQLLFSIMSRRVRNEFNAKDNADFAYVRVDGARFRVNVFRHLGGIGAVFRHIPPVDFTLESLGLPEVLETICMQKRGLILVTGKTGSGKSTTLAAMVDSINRRVHGHVLTIEDPVEFVHQRKRCLISQREVGDHTPSFAAALRSALREDPDVILVGEMRDLETTSLAVTAAETGILVMGTLHTNGAAATVDRIINTFPVEKQPHVRTMLSTSLKAVVSQQLVPKADGSGVVAAVELLVNTPAVANLIREGKLDQIESVMQSGAAAGMQSMDNALQRLLDDGLISAEAAYEAAQVKSRFQHLLESA